MVSQYSVRIGTTYSLIKSVITNKVQYPICKSTSPMHWSLQNWFQMTIQLFIKIGTHSVDLYFKNFKRLKEWKHKSV